MSPDVPMSQPTVRRIGYVVKCYPRFSETFIVNEILAREAAGDDIAIAALRTTTDVRFHALLARVQAPVSWMPVETRGSTRMWQALDRLRALRANLGKDPLDADALEALFDEEAAVAAQAVHLALWALENDRQHLHAHFASISGRTTRVAAKLAGLTWSLTAHAKDIFHESNDPARLRAVLTDADQVVGVSDMTAEWIRGLAPSAKVTRIYNGMDLDVLTFTAPVDRPARVVGVGRLVAKKGWPEFIKAIAMLRAQGVPATADIAGTGPLEAELHQLAHELGLDDAITWHGPVPQHEVIEMVRSAAVFAAPCVVADDGDRDGLPTVLLESMALGTPVVGTPVAGIPEAVHHDRTGLLVAEHDPAGLTAALKRMITDADLRVRLATAARTHIEAHFDIHDQARHLRDLTERVAHTSTTSPDGPEVIYVVTDPGIPAYGRKGGSAHVQEILRELVGRSRKVTLVAARLGGAVPPGLEGVTTIELGRPRTATPAEAERALQDLDRQAAQIVDALVSAARAARPKAPIPLVYQRYGLWSADVLERAAAAGARTILEINAPLVDEQRTHRVLVDEAGARALTQRAIRAADLAYAVSGPVARWAEELAGVDVAVIGNGVDVDRFTGTAGSGAEPPTVVFVGTFRPWHAPDLLVEAAARLQQAGTPITLLLVGDGPSLAETVATARAAGVEVEATGLVEHEAVPGLLARADIACAPYPAGEAYFSPLKLIEYLGAGLPTVASAIADLPELIGADEAILIAPGDLEALTAALAELVRDPARRAALGRAARAAAATRFTWQAVVDRMFDLLDSVEGSPVFPVAERSLEGEGPGARPVEDRRTNPAGAGPAESVEDGAVDLLDDEPAREVTVG
ncbi:MAG: glycosyltransferase family 4 protein [Propionibacteriaceae bacterium]|nr:glycosyltransferase family 4 protein [Propionibacteriaceae bacterium]